MLLKPTDWWSIYNKCGRREKEEVNIIQKWCKDQDMVCDTEMVYCFDYIPTVWECEAYLCDKPIAKNCKVN